MQLYISHDIVCIRDIGGKGVLIWKFNKLGCILVLLTVYIHKHTGILPLYRFIMAIYDREYIGKN